MICTHIYIYIYCTKNINKYVIWDIPCKPGYMMFVFHLLWRATFFFRRWLDKGPREGCASGARQEETDAGWQIVWVWWNPILKWWKTGIYLGKLHRPHCSPSLKSLSLQGNHHQMAWIQVSEISKITKIDDFFHNEHEDFIMDIGSLPWISGIWPWISWISP